MPSATHLYQYSHVPETKENLEWADRKCKWFLIREGGEVVG